MLCRGKLRSACHACGVAPGMAPVFTGRGFFIFGRNLMIIIDRVKKAGPRSRPNNHRCRAVRCGEMSAQATGWPVSTGFSSLVVTSSSS
jgi:hypothetical protein